MKLAFAVLIILSTYEVFLCQKKYEEKAIINKQSGDAYYRYNKEAKEILLSGKKKVGKKLYPDEEIRCGKNCAIELLMCTKSKETIKEEDGWYRVPNIPCSEDFIPGLKNTLRPGGGQTNNKFYMDKEELLRLIPRETSRMTLGITGDYSRKNTYNKIPRFELFELELVPLSSIFVPNYSNIWYFQYPYEGAVVTPKLFTFDIVQKTTDKADKTKLHLVVALSAFENNNSLSVSREWKKELFLQNDLLTNIKGENFKPQEVEVFLEEARKYYGNLPARIYCTITVAEVNATTNLDNNPRTFGFEFNVMTTEDEKIILNQLDLSTKETGFAHYIGRAEIFERLGLIKFAINEYAEGLKEFPENEQFGYKLSILQRVSKY